MKKIILIFSLVWTSLGIGPFQPFVLYGDDDRLEVHERARVQPEISELSQAVMAIFPKESLIPLGNGSYKMIAPKLAQVKNLCADEKYSQQPAPADCSAVLIGEDLVLTAGHCVEVGACSDAYFAFGFEIRNSQQSVSFFPEKDVYRCKEVLAQDLSDTQDYGVIRLDRKVQDRSPLRLAQKAVSLGDPVFLLGHPSGVPMKWAGNGSVKQIEPTYFMADLDAFGGNSGSPVFDSKTLEIVGILVRGVLDYEMDKERQCRKTRRCETSHCVGEDITRSDFLIEQVLKNYL